jgi:glutathione S-transferase
MTLTLYDHPSSRECYAVRLMLGLLGLPHERVMLSEDDGRPEPAALPPGCRRDMTPPVLVDDGLVLGEVEAIIAYLARRYDWRDQWLPADDPRLFGNTMMWLGTSARLLRALHPDGGVRDGFRAAGKTGSTLRLMDDHLAVRHAEGWLWFVGRTPTIADVTLFAAAATNVAETAASPYPDLRRWMQRVRELPGYAAPPDLAPPAAVPDRAARVEPAIAEGQPGRTGRKPTPLDVARGSELVLHPVARRQQQDWFKLNEDRTLS